MDRVKRLDVVGLAAPVMRSDGTLLVDGRVARTGVLTYTFADGSVRRELVPPDELFRDDSMSSLVGRIVTNDHPPGLIDARTARAYAVGAVCGAPRRDGDWLAAPMSVFDAEAVAAVMNGKSQLSSGYECDIEITPGVTEDGEAYDVIQRNREYNHQAICYDARAGAGAAIRLDSSSAPGLGVRVQTDAADARGTSLACARPNLMQGSSHMATEKTETKMTDAEALASLHTQLNEATVRASAAEAQASVEKSRADALEGKQIELTKALEQAEALVKSGHVAAETAAIQKERERADALETRVTNFDASFEMRVRERATLQQHAATVLGDTFRFDKMSDDEIVEITVKTLDPQADVKSIAKGVLRGRFDAMIERRDSTARDIGRTANVMHDVERKDAAAVYTQTQRALWKQPLPSSAHKKV